MSLSKIDIRNAVKIPSLIKDPYLKGFQIVTKNGNLIEWSGGFSMVYLFSKETEKCILKIWDKTINNNKKRYEAISAYLEKCKLPYFVDFEYVENGIFINGAYYDTLRMEWVEGLNLVEFISANLDNKDVLKKLSKDFIKMAQDLHENQISHGDLQHTNIIIDKNGEIKLIDYDSLCIPEFEGQRDSCRGFKGYQLPSRIYGGFISSINIDNFSKLIIYTTICAVIENPLLWDKYDVPLADYRLLFKYDDFLNWEDAQIRRDLHNYSEEIVKLIDIFDLYINSHNFLPTFSKNVPSIY